MRHGLVPDAQVHAPVPAISRAICLHPPPSWGVGEPKAPFARRGKHGCKPTASPGRGRVKAHQALEACGPCPGEINIKPHRNTMVFKRGNSPRPLSHASASPLQWQRSFSSPRVVRTSSSMHTVPSPSAIRCRCCAAPIPPSVLDGFGLCVQPLVEGREGGREVRGPSSRVDVTSQSTSGRWDKSGLLFAS